MSRKTLGTLVTYNPYAVGPATLLEDIAARFEELRIHHVPVVDDQRRVVGVISELDLLRAKQSQPAALVTAGKLSDTDEAPPLFARDVMTRDVLAISPSDDFAAALTLLLKRRIHSLPVISDGRLVGMVSSRDFLREFSYGELPASREPLATLLLARPSDMIAIDATLEEALTAMGAGGAVLAVCQGDRPLGIISQRDIVRQQCLLNDQMECHSEFPLPRTVIEITRSSPPFRSGQRLCEAAAAMLDHGLSAVTVVNQSNQLLGLITDDDLLRVLYDAQA